MNRRDLLKRFGLAVPALALAPLAKGLTIPTPLPTSFTMLGWRCRWEDWHPISNSVALVGVWVAYSTHSNEWHLCSPWPGRGGPVRVGSVFDLSKQSWQTIPTSISTEAELDHYKSESLEFLKRMITLVGPPPFDLYKFDSSAISWGG